MDDELEAIRARRIAELQKNYAPAQGSHGMNIPQNGASPGDDAQQQKQKEEMRINMLRRILEPDAQERLSRIGLVKRDKQRQIEDYLLQMAQSGRLSKRVDGQDLIQLLEQYSEQAPKMRVTINRRRSTDDEEE